MGQDDDNNNSMSGQWRSVDRSRTRTGRRKLCLNTNDMFGLCALVFILVSYFFTYSESNNVSYHQLVGLENQRMGSLKDGWSLISESFSSAASQEVVSNITKKKKKNATTAIISGGSMRHRNITSFSTVNATVSSFRSLSMASENLKQQQKEEEEEEKEKSVAPWRTSKVLPQWMKDYFQWHEDSLQKIVQQEGNNWEDYDYLVARCLIQDGKCGGGADRLKSLPFLLLLANRTQRLLFFHWERPAALQEFLVPPPNGLNWTWPPHPAILLDKQQHQYFSKRAEIENGGQINYYSGYIDPNEKKDNRRRKPPSLQNKRVVSIKYQSHNHGRIQYDALRNNETDASYMEVFRDCWYSVFIPSPPVQERIDKYMKKLDLKKHNQQQQYHAIHIRSRYKNQLKSKQLYNVVSNSVNCLQHITINTSKPLDKDTVIFMASDGRAAIRATAKYGYEKGLHGIISRQGTILQQNSTSSSSSNNLTTTTTSITTRQTHEKEQDQQEQDEEEPLHLDRGMSFFKRNSKEFTTHGPHEYYDTFVDLYLLSYAQCIVFGTGNYGRWANLLSNNITCHRDTVWGPKSSTQCAWLSGNEI